MPQQFGAGTTNPFTGNSVGGSYLDQWKAQAPPQQVAPANGAQPHWWDTLMAQAAPLLNPFKLGAKVATEHHMTPIANILNPIGSAEDTLMAAQAKVFDTASHVLSTGFQMANPGNPLYDNGFQMSDLGKMWDTAQTVSPGQAFTVAMAQSGRKFLEGNALSALGVNAGQGAGTIASPGFDISDPAQQKKLADNNFWNVGTGAVDVGIQVLTAKGMGAAGSVAGKAAGLQKYAMDARALTAARDVMESHPESTVAQGLADSTQVATKANPIGDNVSRLTESKNMTEIMTNPLVSQSPKRAQLAALIRDSDSYDVTKELILADHGDRQALVNLLGSGHADSVWRMTNLNETFAKSLFGDAAAPLDEATGKAVDQAFTDHINRDPFRKQVLDTFTETGEIGDASQGLATAQRMDSVSSIRGINYAGKVGELPGMQAVRNLGVRAANAAGNVRQVAQAGEYVNSTGLGEEAAARALGAKPMQFTSLSDLSNGEPQVILAQSPLARLANTDAATRAARLLAGRRALNMVTLSGMRANDVMDEAAAYMNGTTSKRLENVVIHGKDSMGNEITSSLPIADYRQQVLSKLADNIGNETVTKSIVDKMERDMVASVVARRGSLDAAAAQPFLNGMKDASNTWHEDVRDKGFFYDNAGRKIITDPQTRAQLASSISLTDLTNLDRAMGSHGVGANALTAFGLRTEQTALKAFDAGQQMFRVATLFRAAYTPKNSIAEPLTASMLAHGAFASQDGVLNAAREFISNSSERLRAVGLKVADATSLTPYRRNQNELIRLHQDRIDKEAALDRLNTNLEKLDGRSPAWQAANWPDLQDQRDKVNQALQNIHVTLDRTDPEWRIADAASKFPSALSLEATHKALMMGLTNPRYYQRLRNRSVAYEARAVAAEAKGDLERADSLRGQRDYLAKQADKWEATTAEQKAAALPHAEALAAHIATLKDALNDPGAFTAEKRAAAVEARDAATAALGQSLATFSEKVAKREYVKVQSAAKPVAIRYGNGEVHMAGGLADPKIAQSGLMDEYGAHNTQHMTYNPQTLVGTTKAQMKRDGTSVPVKPSEPLYYKEWAYSINKHLRNDPVARQIMAGRTDAQIADWLTSPAGIDHAKAMGWKQESDVSGQVVEDHPLTNYQAEKIADTKAVIQEYLPTPELRQQALDGEVRLSHLTRVPPEAMPTVSAGTLSAKLDRSPIARANNASQIIWDKIASDPETYVGRNPYARREYSLALQRSVKQAEDQGYRMTPDAINAMKYSARKQALVNTEKTFYTIRRQNNLVEMSRFLTTYPAATVNSFVRFNRLRLENPGRGLAQQQATIDLYRHFGVDENGNPVDNPADAKNLVFALPGFSPPGGGNNKFTLSTKSLQLIGGDLSPSWTTVLPIEIMSANHPEFDANLKSFLSPDVYNNLFPFGTQGSPAATFEPGLWKDMSAMLDPNSTRRREFAVTQYKWEYANWINDKQKFERGETDKDPGPPPDPKDSTEAASKFSLLMAVSHFFVPGSPNVQQAADYGTPEMQAVRGFYDQARQAAATSPDVVSGKTTLSKQVAEEMHAQHMDWIYPLIQSTSSSLFSLPSSTDAASRFAANRDLVATIEAQSPKSPSAAAVLFGDLPFSDAASASTADSSVSAWMRGQSVGGKALKSASDVTTFAGDIQTEMAWQEYERAVATRDATLANYGGVNPQTGKPAVSMSDVPGLADQWNAWFNDFSAQPQNRGMVDEMRSKNPDKGMASVRALSDIVSDPSKVKSLRASSPDPAYWSSAQDYIRQRSSVEAQYATLVRSGDSASAKDLQGEWDHYIRTQAGYSKSFLDLYDRYLSGYDMTSYDSSKMAAS